MRRFTIPARRSPTITLPFSPPFVQVRAGTPERVNTAPAMSDHRADDGGQSPSNHDYATAAIRLSRTYW